MTAYPFAYVAITTNKVVANKIAAAIDPSPGGGDTFGHEIMGVNLRVIGSTGPATAWAARGLLPAPTYGVFREFIDDPASHPAAMLAAGLTAQDIDDGHACMTVAAGPREDYERALMSFIAANGYERV
jgi:hypothetical protein